MPSDPEMPWEQIGHVDLPTQAEWCGYTGTHGPHDWQYEPQDWRNSQLFPASYSHPWQRTCNGYPPVALVEDELTPAKRRVVQVGPVAAFAIMAVTLLTLWLGVFSDIAIAQRVILCLLAVLFAVVVVVFDWTWNEQKGKRR